MLLVMLVSAPVVADPVAPVEPAGEADKAALMVAPPPPPPPRQGVAGQFGISLRLGLGLRAITTYDKGVYCGTTDASTSSGYAPVCVGRSPFALDLEASYGLRARLEAFLELRLGIESDFGSSPLAMDGPHIVHLSPGLRLFFSEAKRTKLFSTLQLVLDFSGYKQADGIARSSDFGVRNLNGLQFEIDRRYAVYGFVGETLTFVRWLGFELEAGVGFAAHY